jgi:hypothetical protein
VETLSRLALIVVVEGAASSAASAAATTAAAPTAVAAAAACEVGEPAPSLVRVRPRAHQSINSTCLCSLAGRYDNPIPI